MRNCLLSMLTCAALLMACQQVTPTPIKTASSSINLEINDDAPIKPASIGPTEPQSPPSPSVPDDTLSSDPIDQNNNQNEIDIATGTVTESIETAENPATASPNVTPKVAATRKTFDPVKIIGFATQTLLHNLGRAKIIRTEGPIEVWQYQFESCVVDFFFYPFDEGSSQLILKTWDMRSTIMGNSLNKDDCRNEINLYHQTILSNS